MSEKGYLHRRSSNFGKVPFSLLADKSISAGAVRLYAYMHWRYGSNCDNHEGRTSMADFMGVSKKTITKYTHELEASDWIVILARKSNRGSETNFYHVFEIQEDCQAWRAEKNHPKPKYDIEIRKGREGIGGKPTHNNVNSNSLSKQRSDTVNSSSSTPVNSSSHNPDSFDPEKNILADAQKAAPPAPPEKPRTKRKPVPVKTLADLDQLRRVIAINAHGIKTGQGITGRAMIRINMAAQELRERFGLNGETVTGDELAEAFKWYASKPNAASKPKDPVKMGDMVSNYRDATGKTFVIPAERPDPTCPNCGGAGILSMSNPDNPLKSAVIPCATCRPMAYTAYKKEAGNGSNGAA